LDFSGALWVQEKEEFSHTCDNVERIKRFSQVFKLREGGHQFENIVFEIFFFQIAIPITIVKTNLNPSLEKVYFPDHEMKEWYDLDPTEFVSFKFEESRGCEKLSTFSR
jgi:hypothetical protein